MTSLSKQQKWVLELRAEHEEYVLPQTPFPKPFCRDINKVKAIYLGCDPSNRHCHCLEYVFALPDGNPPIFRRLVRQIGENLKLVGLSWDVVYVQNLCQNYFAVETSVNPVWQEVAKSWLPKLRKDLSQFEKHVPVLLSAEILYKFLLRPSCVPKKAADFYKCKSGADIPIPPEINRLGRPLIPFYRHRAYDLHTEGLSPYRFKVSKLVK